MGQEVLRSFGKYSELILINEMCFGESQSPPSQLVGIFFRLICYSYELTKKQPNCAIAANNINKVYYFKEYYFCMFVTSVGI